MVQDNTSGDTGMLQSESLQLDVQMLQKYREEEKQELFDFPSPNLHSNCAAATKPPVNGTTLMVP
jgi:hypothetical protein